MNKQIGSELRTLFIIQALGTGLIGLLAMVYPSFIIRISGVDPKMCIRDRADRDACTACGDRAFP